MTLDVPPGTICVAERVANRIAELERECDELRARSELIHATLEANRRIAGARRPDAVIAETLRAMRAPLGFSRAIYFSVDRAHGIHARYALDGDDRVVPADGELIAEPGSVVSAVLRGEPHGPDVTSDLSAPLADVRGWYAFSALEGAEGTVGLLYGDGHARRHPAVWISALVKGVASVAAIAIENETLFARTQELAARDPLTGLYNRRAFAERTAATIEAADAERSSFAFVLVDVDDFKAVNDRFGHAAGDDALRALATALANHTRTGDVVARYAGDEFALLMNAIDPELARTLVGRLSAHLAASGLRCSLGAALYPHDARDSRGLLEAADAALYRAKAAGKNGYSFYR